MEDAKSIRYLILAFSHPFEIVADWIDEFVFGFPHGHSLLFLNIETLTKVIDKF